MFLNHAMIGRTFLLLVVAFAFACGGSSKSDAQWPLIEALPTAPPGDLNTSAPATVLREGNDGYLYIVGGFSDTVVAGTHFLGRYSGDWPLDDLPRPPLVTGRVLKVFENGVALVSATYTFPDINVEGLEVTFSETSPEEDIGKGLGHVARGPTAENPNAVTIALGSDVGVQTGDLYAVLAPAVDTTAVELQLARRLVGVCLVNDVSDTTSSCRRWQGSTLHPAQRQVIAGDEVLFLEHTFGREPESAVIQIASFGPDAEVARTAVDEGLRAYVASLNTPNVTIESLPTSLDATRRDFYRVEQDVEYTGRTQLVVAGSIRKAEDGTPHLVLNYTGIGPATGPGMIAAPPEGGVDLGPVDDVKARDIVGFASVVWSAVNVYRGQTSEALIQLTHALSDDALRGPLRWHARDQLAMRWVALGHVRQGMWLVHQDMAIATTRNDRDAYLNALGTAVRLYDMLGLKDAAVQSSTEYLAAREAEKPDTAYLSAVSMHAEMLMGAGKTDEAAVRVREIISLCDSECESDLSGLLAAVYWATPAEKKEIQSELLDTIVSAALSVGGGGLASARIYQGIVALRDEKLEDALIAFLESERLYKRENFRTGVARAKYFIMLTQMARQEPDEAFKAGVEAVEIHRELQDFSEASLTYERLSGLYVSMDRQSKPGPYLGAAKDVLAAAVSTQLAMGDYGKASQGLFNMATFLLKVGQLDEAKVTYQRAVLFAIRSTRFDVAAMAHLSLGMVAREENDADTFRDEISRARVMAEISGEPGLKEAIERALSPRQQEPDIPTQLL